MTPKQTLQVKQPFHSDSLIEAMQMQKIRYAFVKRVAPYQFECLHPYAMCRDYLKDTLYARHTKNQMGRIYGFDVDKVDKDAICKTHLLMAVTGSKKDIDLIYSRLDLIRSLEKNHGVKPCLVRRFEPNKSNAGLLIKADKRWMDSLLGFSYYSYLWRMFSYKDWDNESSMRNTWEDDWFLTESAMHLKGRNIDDINKYGFFEKSIGTDLCSLHECYGLYYVSKARSFCGGDYAEFVLEG